jgi:flagellar basal-body rod protein FlgB
MEITGITAEVSATLSYLVRAQEMVATNIANVNQPGYVPQDVDFQAFVASLRTSGSISSEAVSTALDHAATSAKKSNTGLVDEVAQTELIAMRYGELLEVLGRHLSLYGIAANKGR